MLREGMYAIPPGVLKANHAFMHAPAEGLLYTNGVGITLSVYWSMAVEGLKRQTGGSKIPRFLYVVQCRNE